MTDQELLTYVQREMQGQGLPAIIGKIKKQQADLIPSALVPGDTDRDKYEIQALAWVIDLIINFENHVEPDTDGDTGE